MSPFKHLITAITLILAGNATAAALPALPAASVARAIQINAKLSANERAWIRQEAAREKNINTVSEAVAAQAARSGSGLDFSKMSVEDAVLMVMLAVSEDARNDLRAMRADMEQTRQKKSALRAAKEKQAEDNRAAKDQFRAEMAQQATGAAPTHARLANRPLIARPVATDTNSDLSEQQHLKMQMLMDRMHKAESTASNLAK